MDEEKFKSLQLLIKESWDREKAQFQERSMELVQSIIIIPLEGFVSDQQKIVVAEDLVIEKVTSEARDKFYLRAARIELDEYKNANNWFFITYKYQDERGRSAGIFAGDRILLIAIFFAICSNKLLRINKGESFTEINGELKSLGVLSIPNASWVFNREVRFDEDEIANMAALWPLFRDSYKRKQNFALVARRFYFSIVRNQWEDQCIDLCIALEALLIYDLKGDNKQGKIARRLSRLLESYYLRGKVAKIAKEGYDLRNKIVHGKIGYGGEVQNAGVIDQLRLFLRRAIQEYLIKYRDLATEEFVNDIEQMSGDQI